MLRKVELSKWVYTEPRTHVKKVVATGLLHGWATETDDGENYAVAIVETEGGQVDTWPAHMVRFVDGDANE